MRDIAIIGIGQTPVADRWEKLIREIAGDAVIAAMNDAGREWADSIFVGNMLSGIICHQENLGTLIADWAGLRGIEAFKVEAACRYGAAEVLLGVMAIASGMIICVISLEPRK